MPVNTAGMQSHHCHTGFRVFHLCFKHCINGLMVNVGHEYSRNAVISGSFDYLIPILVELLKIYMGVAVNQDLNFTVFAKLRNLCRFNTFWPTIELSF